MSGSEALHPAEPLAGATTVHLGLVDASGTLREKRLSAAAAERALRSGWSFIDAMDGGAPTTPCGVPAARAAPAARRRRSARPYPFGDDAAFFLADFAPPLRDLSPRARTQDLVKRAAAAGSKRAWPGSSNAWS